MLAGIDIFVVSLVTRSSSSSVCFKLSLFPSVARVVPRERSTRYRTALSRKEKASLYKITQSGN